MASHQECVLFGHLHVNENIVPTCILVNHEFSILQYGGVVVFSDSKKICINSVCFVCIRLWPNKTKTKRSEKS